MPTKLTTLTPSSLSTFRQCPRRYFYTYEAKRVALKVSDALSFGTLMHGALEKWWGANSAIGGRMQASMGYIDQGTLEDEGDAPFKAAALMASYNPPVHSYGVTAIEKEFCEKIESPKGGRCFRGYRISGKIDLVLVKNGDPWVADHKTHKGSIDPGGQYFGALEIDSQMGIYCLATGARGFVYDVIQKPGIKCCAKDEKAAQAHNDNLSEDHESSEEWTDKDAYFERLRETIQDDPSAYYQWVPYTLTDQDLHEAKERLWSSVDVFHYHRKRGLWEQRTEGCITRYGACPYLDVCCGRAMIDDDGRYRDKVRQHEELEGVGE